MIKKIFFIIIFFTCANFTHDLVATKNEIAEKIGLQIWQNEALGREDLLVFWNEKEAFPSLGIGHAIWLPEHHEVNYTQAFVLLCNYLKNCGVILPLWIQEALPKGAPWKNREEFYNDHERLKELRQLLVSTIDLQMLFMIERLEQTLPIIIKSLPKKHREKVRRYVNFMLDCPEGTYALVDYLNFKGDGLNPAEKINGQGWGLWDVLLAMPNDLTPKNVVKAFSIIAAKKLLTRIENTAPDYAIIHFLEGWMKRISTYTKLEFNIKNFARSLATKKF